MDPTQIHEPAGGKRASRPSLHRLIVYALCAVVHLSAARILARELPPPPGQQPQTTAENAPPVVLATVHGVVCNAATGQPLPRALVRIEGDADTGALTNGDGRFEIPGVPVGPQTIQVRKPGFHDRPYATEDVDYQDDGPAHSVLVATEMPELEFRLSPTSAIHGRIELSTGDPAQGITVVLLKQVVRNGRAVWAQNGQARTSGNGAYRFANLPGGIYALFTQPALESEPAATAVAAGARVTRYGYPSLFYPEAREFSDAARIRLRAGQQAEANLLLPLEPFHTVTAIATLPNGRPLGGNSPSEGVFNTQRQSVLVLDAAGRQLDYTGGFDARTHSIQVSLPDGSYTLLASVSADEPGAAGQGNSPGRASRNRTTSLSGFAELSVEGRAVANLRLPLAPTSSWPIHLRIVRTASLAGTSGQGPQTPVIVTATYAGEAPMGEASAGSQTEDAGPDLLELNAIPGPHWIGTEVNDRSLCVDSFTAGGINLAREPLNVALGTSAPPMELTLRDDCAKLTLELPSALSVFLPGDEPFYTVYVIPDFDTTADIPPMNMHPSSGATLTVEGLSPGSYHVYTFTRPVRLEYRNPAVLAALPMPGQQVTLSAGSTGNLMLEVPGR